MAHHLSKGDVMTDTERNIDDAVLKARQAAERAADRASDAAEDFGDEAGERIEDVADAVGEVIRDVRDAATGAVENVAAQASAAASGARESLDEGVAYVKAQYRERPGVVIAIGAVALLALGLAIKALMRR